VHFYGTPCAHPKATPSFVLHACTEQCIWAPYGLQSALFDQTKMDTALTIAGLPTHPEGWHSVDDVERVLQHLPPMFSLTQGVPHYGQINGMPWIRTLTSQAHDLSWTDLVLLVIRPLTRSYMLLKLLKSPIGSGPRGWVLTYSAPTKYLISPCRRL
jgi:hypothetical protein